MSFKDNWIIISGVFLLFAGILLIIQRKKCRLPSAAERRLRRPEKFFATLGVIVFLAGAALVLSPFLIVNMGIDFWILFFMGVFACLLLLFTFFLN